MARGDDTLCKSPGYPAAPCATGTNAGPKTSSDSVSTVIQPRPLVAGHVPGIQLDNFLAEAAAAPADCGAAMELPPWFDWDKFKTGQQYFFRHLFALFVGKLSGLLCVLAIPSILRVLCFTRQSGEGCSAFRRYFATLVHMLDWYKGDLLEPASRAYQSLSQVRARHSVAAKRARKANVGVMSQLDMSLTQFGFMGFALLSPEKLGVPKSSDRDVEGFIHFWRTVGYLLGIEDRFNLCRESVEETKALCRAVRDQVFKPAMQNSPKEFDTMARALVEGMQCMVPSVGYETFIALIKQDLLDIKHDDVKLPILSRLNLFLHRFVNRWLLGVPALAIIFRPFFNAAIRLSIYLTRQYPILAYWRFGKEQVHQ